MRRWHVVGLAVIVCVLVFASCGKREEAPSVMEKPAAAAVTSFDALLPQDTALLLYTPDIARYKERFQASAMHAMWADPSLNSWKQDFFQPHWAKLEGNLGFDLDEFFELFQKDAALVIEIPEQMTIASALPMVYARFGENTEKAKSFLRTQVIGALKQHIPDLVVSDQVVEGQTITVVDFGRPELAYTFLDDLWVLGPTVDRVARVAKRQKQTEANWTSSAGYMGARKMHDPAADMYLWANLERATQWARQLIAQAQTGNAAHAAEKIQALQRALDSLGLFDMEYLAATSTLKGKGVYRVTNLTFTIPRRGVFGLLEATKELKVVKMLPPTTQSYTVLSVKSMSDILALIKEIGNSVEPEQFSAGFEQASAQVKQTLGFGLDEICAMIGSEYAFIAEQGMPIPFMALLVELKDTQKFRQLLDTMMTAMGVQAQSGEYGGISYKMIMIPMAPVQLCVAICGEYLVLSSGLPELQRIIDTKTSGKYVEPVEEFEQLKLAGNMIEQSCSKPADLSQMQPMLLMALQGINAQLAEKGMQAIPMNAIPNLAAISNHMFPSVSRSFAQEKAIISEAYSVGGEEIIAAGIVGVMAAVAVPNFQEAQERSKVSRVKADQRSLATALEAYAVDCNAYALWEMRTDFQTPRPTFMTPRPGKMLAGSLTTPIAYITGYVVDPFSPGKNEWFSYYTSDKAWILISAGPDKVYDIMPQQDFRQPRDSTALWNTLVNKTYDPTNGTVSSGDIWRSNLSYY